MDSESRAKRSDGSSWTSLVMSWAIFSSVFLSAAEMPKLSSASGSANGARKVGWSLMVKVSPVPVALSLVKTTTSPTVASLISTPPLTPPMGRNMCDGRSAWSWVAL